MQKFVVSYELDYVHRVMVGVAAETAESALSAADAAFKAGSLWDNTPGMPLLFDDYEETDGGQVLAFQAMPLAEFPRPDASVAEIKRRESAFRACRLLSASCKQGGDIDWECLGQALEQALRALAKA